MEANLPPAPSHHVPAFGKPEELRNRFSSMTLNILNHNLQSLKLVINLYLEFDRTCVHYYSPRGQSIAENVQTALWQKFAPTYFFQIRELLWHVQQNPAADGVLLSYQEEDVSVRDVWKFNDHGMSSSKMCPLLVQNPGSDLKNRDLIRQSLIAIKESLDTPLDVLADLIKTTKEQCGRRF